MSKQMSSCQVAGWIHKKNFSERKQSDKGLSPRSGSLKRHNVNVITQTVNSLQQAHARVCICTIPCVLIFGQRVWTENCQWRGAESIPIMLHLSGGAVSLDNLNEMHASHLQFKTFNLQLLLGAEFCSGRSMRNDWKIANVIYIKVRLEETNYASDSRQYS